MESKIDKEVGEYIRSYGKKDASGNCTIHLPLFIEVDGRNFADELEDSTNTILCTVDYLGITSSSTSPWFHMYETRPGNFPLASNDKYNFSALSYDTQEQILSAFKSAYKDVEISEKQLKELKRSKWLGWAKAKIEKSFIVESIADKNEISYSDFNHIVDCRYCCHQASRDKFDDLPYQSIEEMKQYIIDTCDNRDIALALKIIYPTYDTMFKSAYLAFQSHSRYERWRTIVPYVYDNIDKHISEEEYDNIILSEIPGIVNNLD